MVTLIFFNKRVTGMIGMVSILIPMLCSIAISSPEVAGMAPDQHIQSVTQELNWYRDIQRKYFLEFQVPSDVTGIGANLNPDEMARELKETGAQAVGIFAKDYFGNAFYPTHFPRVHPGLDFDLFGRMAMALHAQGVRVIAYYHVVGNPLVAEQHPDWLVLRADGTPKPDGNQPTLSVLSPYTEEVLLPQIKEILAYPVDGFFFDGSFIAWADYNPFARAKYKTETGHDMPITREDPSGRNIPNGSVKKRKPSGGRCVTRSTVSVPRSVSPRMSATPTTRLEIPQRKESPTSPWTSSGCQRFRS